MQASQRERERERERCQALQASQREREREREFFKRTAAEAEEEASTWWDADADDQETLVGDEDLEPPYVYVRA